MTSHQDPNADNGGLTLVVLGWTFSMLSLLIVVLRLWTRVFFLKSRLFMHDILMVIAVLFEIGQAILINFSFNYGIGHHSSALSPYQRSESAFYAMIAEPFGLLSNVASRISCALLLITTLLPMWEWKRYTLVSLILVQTVVTIFLVIEHMAQCGTHIRSLEFKGGEGHCLSPHVEEYTAIVQVTLSAVTDLLLTVLPFMVLRKLQMRRRDMIAISIVLGLSIFACVAAIVRGAESVNLQPSKDFTWNIPIYTICVTMETAVVIICGSIFALVPLWKHVSGAVSSRKRSQHLTPMAAPETVPRGASIDAASAASSWGNYGIKKTQETVVDVEEGSPDRETPPPPPSSNVPFPISCLTKPEKVWKKYQTTKSYSEMEEDDEEKPVMERKPRS